MMAVIGRNGFRCCLHCCSSSSFAIRNGIVQLNLDKLVYNLLLNKYANEESALNSRLQANKMQFIWISHLQGKGGEPMSFG